jgi:Dimerisation domain of Zinc Transporter
LTCRDDTTYLTTCVAAVATRTTHYTAPGDFIAKINALADEHHPDITIDCTKAYLCGAQYIVEVEIVMPPESPLKETHDIALELQHKIENIDNVERAFVHVDHTHRDVPEHKVERLLLGSKTINTSSSDPSSVAHTSVHS